MSSSKGASDYFSHILALAIAIVVLSVVASTFHEYYVNKSIESQEAEAHGVMRSLETKVLGMYSEYRSREMETVDEGEVVAQTTMDIPEEIGGRGYGISLNSAKDGPYINVSVDGFPEKAYRRSLYSIDVDVEGSVSGCREIRLNYIKGNGTDTLELLEEGH